MAAAWNRATDGKTDGKYPTNVSSPAPDGKESAASLSQASSSPSQTSADTVLQSILHHSQAVTEREELKERKKTADRRSPTEYPRRSTASSPSMYHVNKSLDPSLVLQQSCASHHIPLSPESLDELLTSYKAEPSLEDAVWTYIDLQGFEQGPFPSSTMRAWFEQGFLTSSLMIRYLDGPWRPLRLYFKNLNDAFLTLPQIESRKTAGTSETQKRVPKTVAQVLRKRESERTNRVKESVEARGDSSVESNEESNVEPHVEPHVEPENIKSTVSQIQSKESSKHSTEAQSTASKSRKPVRTTLPIEVNYSHSSRPREDHVHQSIEVVSLFRFYLDFPSRCHFSPRCAESSDTAAACPS